MALAATPCAPLELPLPARVESERDCAAEARMGRSPNPKSPLVGRDSSPRSSTKEKNTKVRDNAVTMQLTKTKMCAFFERGKCASANCRYAHSAAELRQPPNLQKTKLCRAFLSGSCKDENCYFAHGESDLRVTEGIYKTQICNFFERGYCKKGDRCNHAHGAQDLRPPSTPSTVATTPLSKMSPGSIGFGSGDSSRTRRSPLPLSELLVIDSEANVSPSYSTIPPTPTKSVTELAQMAFSPVHSSPLWGQYGMHPLSPVNALPVGDLSAMWQPRDAVDMLVQDQHLSPLSPAANLMYAMDAMEPSMDMLSHIPDHTPQKGLELLCLDPSPNHRPAPGLAQLPHSTPPRVAAPTEPRSTPPGLEQPAAAKRDPLMVNLSERLASLDTAVAGLGSDIASIKSDPHKKLHRI